MTTASTHSSEADAPAQPALTARAQSRTTVLKNFFSIPAPLKRLFDQFPRRTYNANDLPARTAGLLSFTEISPDTQERHALLIWTMGAGCRDERVASFNPTCLTWQVQLLLKQQPIQVVASNNHACNIGSALPLLIPNPRIKGPFTLDVDPLSTSDLEKWLAKDQEKAQGAGDASNTQAQQHKIWRSLIDGPIRRGWLYHMYLTDNFELITAPCYISSQTSHGLVRLELRRQLRAAAEEELLKHAPKIDEDSIYAEARDAFAAFEALLVPSQEMTSTPRAWRGLFGTTSPTIVDVSLFSYTFLLFGLIDGKWAHGRLPELLKKFGALYEHAEWMGREQLKAKLQLPSRWTEINEFDEDR